MRPVKNAAMASGLRRFLTVGVSDAERRLARLTAGAAPDDRCVVRLVEASTVGDAVSRGIDRLRTAARSSVIVGSMTARREGWRAQSAAERTRDTGIALLAAAGTHAALGFWQRPVAGWLWLVAPALAAAFGALMVLFPTRGLEGERG